MSVLTTSPMKCAPSAADGVSVSPGTLPVFGAWVELIPSTAAPIAIAGLSLSAGASNSEYVFEIGTGSPGSEVSIGTVVVPWEIDGSALPALLVSGPDGVLLPVPIGGISSATRISVRAGVSGGAGPAVVAVLYYESFSSTQASTASQILSVAHASILPSGIAWTSSQWFELIASTTAMIGILGLGHETASGVIHDGYEYDIGIGAIGSEAVLTTLRDAGYGADGHGAVTWLPGVMPVAAGSRVSVRVRQSITNVAISDGVSLIYYTPVTPPRRRLSDAMFQSGGTTGPLSWIELILKNG